MRNSLSIAVLLGLLALQACHAYRPITSPTSLERGTSVRIHLTGPNDITLTDITVNDAVLIEGAVIRRGREELVVSVFEVVSESGREYDAEGGSVTVLYDRIAGIETKELDAFRTGGIVGLGVAVAVLGEILLDSGIAGGGDDGEGGSETR